MTLQDRIEAMLRNGGYTWQYRIGISSLHHWHPSIPRSGVRLAWAIWRLERRGVIRVEWDHGYKQQMIGLVK